MKIVYIISILLLILHFSNSQDMHTLDMDNGNRIDTDNSTTNFTTDDLTATDSSNITTPFSITTTHHTNNTTVTTATVSDPTPPQKKNLALILGLSLGLGIPVVLSVVGGIIFYFLKRRRPSRILTLRTTF